MDVPAEVAVCRGLHAVGAVPEVDGVEVPLEDGPLRVPLLQLDRHHRFAQLALQVLLRAEHHRAHVLLGDRRPALVEVAGLDVAGECANHAAGVDPVVVEEALVLDRDDGLGQARCHRRERDRRRGPRPRASVVSRLPSAQSTCDDCPPGRRGAGGPRCSGSPARSARGRPARTPPRIASRATLLAQARPTRPRGHLAGRAARCALVACAGGLRGAAAADPDRGHGDCIAEPELEAKLGPVARCG